MTEARVTNFSRLSGIASIVALLINWARVVYLARQYDPGSVRLWGPLDAHPALVLAVVMVLGVGAGIFAGLKSSKLWWLVAVLNLVSYCLELAAS
jgi:hypothetical protein